MTCTGWASARSTPVFLGGGLGGARLREGSRGQQQRDGGAQGLGVEHRRSFVQQVTAQIGAAKQRQARESRATKRRVDGTRLSSGGT
ncbi:MAG: hypothetical protein MUE46_10630, partial [Xanthomonadales bacterium]|nr:hypothetical protein [Xanthomonadales bacterium]